MRTVFAAVAAAVLAISPAAAEWSLKDMNRTIEQTNFLVNDGCSGTLIDATNRYVLTANHCIASQYEVIERETISDDGVIKKEKVRRLRDGTVSQLSFQGSESVKTITYKVKVVAVDRPRDLAVVQVLAKLPDSEAAKLACDEPTRGESVYTVGNPMGVLYSSVTTGVVSSLQRDYGILRLGSAEDSKHSLMQISGGVIGGNSGGAVYNTNGELIGVPVLAHRVNEVLGFAVPLPAIKQFLKDNKLEAIYARCEKAVE